MSRTLIISGSSPQDITIKLIEAGLMTINEGAPRLIPGVVYSHINDLPNESNGMVYIPEEIQNFEEIKTKLGDAINKAGAPLRIVMGQEAPILPQTVSDLQIRLALNEIGLRSGVEAAVEAGSQDLKDWWSKARNFVKTDPMVQGMAATLSVTPEQLDALWELAGTK